MTLFLDTGFFVAFYNKRDKYHRKALEIFQNIRKNEFGASYTSTYILDEMFTYLQKKMDLSYVGKLVSLWVLKAQGFAHILHVDNDLFIQTSRLFILQETERKPLSFTDCSNIILCKAHAIPNIASFDMGFQSYLTVIQ